MGFLALLLYLTAFYIRPGELFPWLGPYQIVSWLGLAALLGSVLSLAFGQRPTFRASQIYLMGLLVIMVMLSPILTQRWFGGSLWALEEFGPAALVFFLIALNVTSLRRLRIVVVLLVVLSSVLVAQGVLAYHYGFRSDLFIMQQQLGPSGEGTALRRIIGLGVLNDPNDLGQALLIALPLATLFWQRGRRLRNLACVYLPILFLLYGIFLTRSRGGVLGLLVLSFFFLLHRSRRVFAILFSGLLLILLLALNFTGGREISMEDESAQDRIAAWSEGLQMLKSSPVWGIGYLSFPEFHERTAHNSFVLCFAELGLTGYSIWLGLLVVSIVELRALRNLTAGEPADLELRRWAGAIQLSLYAFLGSAWFLSRTYTMTLYMLLALGVALADLARRAEKPVPRFSLLHWVSQVGALEFASIALIYATVIIL